MVASLVVTVADRLSEALKEVRPDLTAPERHVTAFRYIEEMSADEFLACLEDSPRFARV